jgi:hypothetical protein
LENFCESMVCSICLIFTTTSASGRISISVLFA